MTQISGLSDQDALLGLVATTGRDLNVVKSVGIASLLSLVSLLKRVFPVSVASLLAITAYTKNMTPTVVLTLRVELDLL